MTIKLNYVDEIGKLVHYQVDNWEAVTNVAQALCNAPIDLEYINYEDGDNVGVFCLRTFEKY